MRKPDWQVFEEKFEPISNKITGDWEKYEWHDNNDLDILNNTENRFIWTVVGGDNGKMYITPGRRFVNRIFYLITMYEHQFESTRDYKY